MPHIHDKVDFTVEVFVVFKDSVLLRKHDKYNVWLSVGGHIEFNEDPNEAAIREVKEEVGLNITLDNSLQTFEKKDKNYCELIPPYFVNRHRINKNHEHVTFTYFAKAESNVIEQLIEDEQSSECKWFTKGELNTSKDITDSVKYYALKALSVLGKDWEPNPSPFADFKSTVFQKARNVSSFIYQIGESEALRKPSQAVLLNNIKTKEFIQKVEYVKKCLLRYREITSYGRGITAVQVGIPEKFSVIYTPEKLVVIINPTVTKLSSTMLMYPEICMSANPIIVPTVRPSWIEFSYYDENGELQYWNTKDDTEKGRIMNRVFQHEIDHMEGIINIDRIKNPRDLILESDPKFYANVKFEEVKIKNNQTSLIK